MLYKKQAFVYSKNGKYYIKIDGRIYLKKGPQAEFGRRGHYVDDEIIVVENNKTYATKGRNQKYISSNGEELIPKKIKTSKDSLEERLEILVENDNGTIFDDVISL